ncbi:uncharacterized protein FMAN_13073 [Fusarium mangiferae]|uniref:Uncharacterized protein n=1 Tax=Fusarium mangiferae TaxID=192010 RepID=A0A1L7U2V8_FUSMA|nr:uncharacterized protein FMAN_13073 [Fusarium mangiferae]CVL05140.1 uncharacterized protein FMAN_13073 [Fusarium mangiferae]
MATNIKIHMVWAGRGDAFILEYVVNEERRLVIVDGGPKTQYFSEDDSFVQAAPYYHHLLSAVREVWGVQEGLILMSMVNSHTDDDHRYGLLRMVCEMPDNIIDWDHFKFYVPFLRNKIAQDGSSTQIVNFEDLVETLNKRQLYPQLSNGYLPDGLHLDYPYAGLDMNDLTDNNSYNHVLQFSRIDPGAAVDLDANADLSTYDGPPAGFTVTNQSSILMRTGEVYEKPVYFTGDSSVRRIGQFVRDDGMTAPDLAIYKIQHHGALTDSMQNPVDLKTNLGMTKESAVYMLLQKSVNDVWPNYWTSQSRDLHEQTNSFEDVAEYCKHVTTHFLREVQFQGTATMDSLLALLTGRRDQWLNLAKTRLDRPVLDLSDLAPWPADHPDPIIIYDYTIMMTTPAPRFPFFWNTYANPTYESWTFDQMQNWFSFAMRDLPCEDFFACWGIYQVAAFYKSFESHTYMVSGSSIPYHHPHVSTLLGLAVACQQGVHTTPKELYMTDPSNMNNPRLGAGARLVGQSRQQLFSGNKLNVYHLDQRAYVTLDGNPVPQADPANPTRPVGQRARDSFTRQISFTDEGEKRNKQILSAFTDKRLLLTRSDLSLQVWAVHCEMAGTKYFLDGLHPPTVISEHDLGKLPCFLVTEGVDVIENGSLWCRTLTLTNARDPISESRTFYCQDGDSDMFTSRWLFEFNFGTPNHGTFVYGPNNDAPFTSVRVARKNGPSKYSTAMTCCSFEISAIEWNTFENGLTEEEREKVHAGMRAINKPPVYGPTGTLIMDESEVEEENSMLIETHTLPKGSFEKWLKDNDESDDEFDQWKDQAHGNDDNMFAEMSIRNLQLPDLEMNAVAIPVDESNGVVESSESVIENPSIPLPEMLTDQETITNWANSSTTEKNAEDGAATSQFAHMHMIATSPDETTLPKMQLETASAITTKVSATEQPSAIVPAIQTESSLRDYLRRIGFDFNLITSRTDALEAITGKQRHIGSKMNLSYEKLLAGDKVHLDASKVEYDSQAALNEFSNATLVALAEAGDLFVFGDDKLKIESSKIFISRQTDTTFNMELSITTDEQVTVKSSRSVELAARFANLRDFLLGINVTPEKLAKITIADLLPLLLQNNTTRAMDILSSRIPGEFVQAGLAKLQPDLDLSPVEHGNTMTQGAPAIKSALIHLQLDGVNKFLRNIKLDTIGVQITRLALGFQNIGAKTHERINLEGAATISAEGNGVVELRLNCSLGEQSTDIDFTAANVSSISKLAGLLSLPYDDMKTLGVPLTNSTLSTGGSGQQTPMPKDLASLNGSEIGFSVRQTVKATDDYRLSSVFIAIKLDDWKDYLPKEFQLKAIEHPKIRVTILNPLTKAVRRVRTEVSFIIPITSSNTIDDPDAKLGISNPGAPQPPRKRSLQVGFLADPVGYIRNDYAYSIALTCRGGISIDDIATTSGIEISPDIKTNVPILSDLLTKVAVKDFEIAAEPKGLDGRLSVTTWSITLLVHDLALIPNQFTIKKAMVNIEKLAESSLLSSGEGEIYIDGLKRSLNVAFKTPQPDSPGFVKVQAPPAGISAQDALVQMGLPSMEDLPVIGTILSTKLRVFQVSFGYAAGSERDLSVFGFETTFFYTRALEFGPLKLENLEVGLMWKSKLDPEVRKDPVSGEKKDVFSFGANACFLNKTLRVDVGYDTRKRVVFATLTPAVKDLTIAGIIKEILPSDLQTVDLVPAVTDMTFNIAGVALDVGKKGDPIKLDRFDLDLGGKEELGVEGNQTEKGKFVLKSLMVSYRRGKPKEQKVTPKAIDPSASPMQGGGNTSTTGEQGSTGAAVPSTEQPKPLAAVPKRPGVERSLTNPAGDESTAAWKDSDEYPEHDTLIVSGTATINKLRTRVSFGYQSGDNKTARIVSLSVVGLDKGALALSNFLLLFGFDPPNYDRPDQSPNFLDLELVRLAGTVEIGDVAPSEQPAPAPSTSGTGVSSGKTGVTPTKKQSKRFTLATADLAVTLSKPFTILESPAVILQELGLEVSYNAKAAQKDDFVGLIATVYGRLDIAGQPLRVLFRKHPKHDTVFLGQLVLGNKSPSNPNDPTSVDSIQFAQLTSQFLNDAKYKPPEDISLPTDIPIGRIDFIVAQGKFVQISGLGLRLAEIPIKDTDLKLSIDKVGGYIKATRDTTIQEAAKYQYDVHLFGQVSISGFDGFLQATATLDIGPKSDTVLFATVVAKPSVGGEQQGGADISSLATRLGNNDANNKWASTSSDAAPLSFSGACLLYVNFTQSRFIIAGQIASVGSAVLMGRRQPNDNTKRGYFFSLVATRPERIWPALEETVSKYFKIEKVAVQVLTFETTLEALREDLDVQTKSVGDGAKEGSGVDYYNTLEEDKKDAVGGDGGGAGGVVTTDNDDDKEKKASEDAVQKMEDAVNIPDVKGIKDGKLLPGAWFFADISLESTEHEMSTALAYPVEKDKTKAPDVPNIIVYAKIGGDGPGSVYSIDVRKLVLLGGAIEINASGSYQTAGRKLENGKMSERQVDVTGELILKQLRQPVTFKVDYHSVKDKTWFALAKNTAAVARIESPFEEMFNVTLRELGISGEITPAGRKYEVFGNVTLGPGDEIQHSLTGRIIFQDGVPIAVFLEYENVSDAKLPVAEVYDKLLKPGNSDADVSWPTDTHPNFKFVSACIYYIRGTKKLTYREKSSYDPGFQLGASVILFDKPFGVSLDIAASRKGIKFQAIYEQSIDLEFAEITGYKEKNAEQPYKGPAMFVDGRQPKTVLIGVKAAISFFKTKPIDMEMNYNTSEKCFEGSIKFREMFAGISEPTIEFIYKNGRFSFKKWDINDALDGFLKLKDILKEGANADKSACGELTNIVFDGAVTTTFRFSLSFPDNNESKGTGTALITAPEVVGGPVSTGILPAPKSMTIDPNPPTTTSTTSPSTGPTTTANPGNDNSEDGIMGKHQSVVRDGFIHLQIDWKYVISIPTREVLTVEMKPLPLEIKPRIDKDGVIATLGELMKHNLPKIATALVSQKENLVQLVGAMLLKECGKWAIKSLLCRGADNEDLVKRGKEIAEEDANQSEGESNEAGKGADGAGAAAAAGAAGGIAVALEELGGALFCLALGIAIGIALWLIGKLVGDRTNDPKVKEDMDKLKDKLDKLHKETMQKLRDALDKIKTAMELTGKPDVKFASDEVDDVSVICDWTKVMPPFIYAAKASSTHPDIRWKLLYSTNADFTGANEVLNINDTKHTIEYPGLEYDSKLYVTVKAYMPVVDDWFKAPSHRTDLKDEPKDPEVKKAFDEQLPDMIKELFGDAKVVEAADWSTPGEAGQVPFLKPPQSVSFTADAAEDTAEGQVTVAGVITQIAINIASPDMKTTFLYSQQHAFAQSDLNVSVRLLAPPGYNYQGEVDKSAKAYVQHISDDQNKFRNSAIVESNDSVGLWARVTNLTSAMNAGKIGAKWDVLNVTALPNPMVFFIKAGKWMKPTSVDLGIATVPHRETTLLAPDEVVNNDKVKIAVCDALPPSGSIALFVSTELLVDYIPTLKIKEKESYYDINTKKLIILVTPTFAGIKKSAYGGDFTSKTAPNGPLPATIEELPSGDVVLAIENVKLPLYTTVKATIQDVTTNIIKSSDPWKLVIPRSTLPKPSITAAIEKDRLVISWLDMQGVSTVRLKINPASIQRDVAHSEQRSSFTAADLKLASLQPGTKLTIIATSLTDLLHGLPTQIDFTIPDASAEETGWTPPVVISPDSTMPTGAGLCVLQNPATPSAITLWTTVSSQIKSYSTVPVTVEPPPTLEAPLTAISTGSSIAAVSLTPTHQEIYWIDPDGAIQARRWTSPQQASPSTTQTWQSIESFPFTVAKTASVLSGGSIAALARSDGKRIDLWWLGSYGRLLKSSFDAENEEWSTPNYLVYGDMGPGGVTDNSSATTTNTTKLRAPSRLAAASVDNDMADVAWITDAGRVHGECALDDDAVGFLYGFWDEGVDAVNASPLSSLAALADDGKSSRLWWITEKGAVHMAVRMGGRSAKARWHVSIVAGVGNAHPRSSVAAVMVGGKVLRVWWFGGEGQLVTARTEEVEETRPSWSVKVQLPEGTARKVGEGSEERMVLAARAVEEREVWVWWIGREGRIWGYRWTAV